jgi:hypothetical protein
MHLISIVVAITTQNRSRQTNMTSRVQTEKNLRVSRTPEETFPLSQTGSQLRPNSTATGNRQQVVGRQNGIQIRVRWRSQREGRFCAALIVSGRTRPSHVDSAVVPSPRRKRVRFGVKSNLSVACKIHTSLLQVGVSLSLRTQDNEVASNPALLLYSSPRCSQGQISKSLPRCSPSPHVMTRKHLSERTSPEQRSLDCSWLDASDPGGDSEVSTSTPIRVTDVFTPRPTVPKCRTIVHIKSNFFFLLAQMLAI